MCNNLPKGTTERLIYIQKECCIDRSLYSITSIFICSLLSNRQFLSRNTFVDINICKKIILRSVKKTEMTTKRILKQESFIKAH